MYSKISYFRPLLFIFVCFISVSHIKAEKSNINFPAFFMKNQGQFNNESKYCLKSAKSNTFFFENHIVNQFITKKTESDTINPDILNLRIDFGNSNPHPVFEERDPLTSKSNYFIGNDESAWKKDIASFASLVYSKLYSNIDLIYYNTSNGIKSDFVIHPGGNYSDIILKYIGVKDMYINSEGALKINTDPGEITEHIPEAYQIINGNKVLVKVNFRLTNENIVKFEVEKYNPAFDLVIDPQLIYCSYLGGVGDDYMLAGDIEKDALNNIYLTGRTNSSDFPVTPGSFSNTTGGMFDAFVLKMNPAGQIIFSTFIGGSGNDMGYSLELTGPGNDIIVTGDASPTFPSTAGAFQTTYNGGTYDVFVLKLNNAGNNLLFSTFLGGASEDQPFDCILDKDQDIYIVGQTGEFFPTTTGSYQEIFGGGSYDVFVSKLSSNGSTLLLSTYIGGSSTDRGVGITVDASENVYISATTSGDFPTTPGCFDNSYNGGSYDIIVAKLDATFKNLIYSTFIGTSAEDQVRGDLILDNSNNLIVVGKAGNGIPTTNGCYQTSYGGGSSDGFVLKLNVTGMSLLYASYLGGTGDDYILFAEIDANSDIIVTGFCGPGFPVTSCTYDDSFNGATDAFIAKINPDITKLLYSTYFGGSNIDNGMAVTSYGDTIIMVGETQSSNIPATINAYDASYNGSTDLFLVKLLPVPNEIPVAKFTISSINCITNLQTSLIIH
jgi:hypothetical protein